ncbi:MAG: glycosyltransferase [Deltaproteobacteria bacterium]|nr:glycosyltransferase [Deltaproteobacteria bacterium]
MGIYKFDIVIVSYKSKAYLLACLESILRSLDGEKGRIFVEDNNSGEDLTGLRKRFPQIELNLNTQNLGFARAANKGISRGNAPYILLINPDSLVRPGFFEQAISFMEGNPSVGILGPMIMNVDGSIQGSARSFPTPLTAWFGRSSLLSRLFPENRITRKNVLSMLSDGTTPMKVDWVSGACMVIRRKALEDVGLFDEQFFMYWEDADICRRMRERRWEVVYFPRAQIVHYSGVSSSQRVFRSLLEFHKSSYAITALAARLGVVLPSTLIRCKLQRALQESGDKGGKIPRLRIQEPNRIRVLRVISRLNIGGPAIHVHVLNTGLNDKKFESLLIAGRISPGEGDMSYLFGGSDGKVVTIPELQREIDFRSDIKAVWKILKIIRQEEPQIIHSHTAKAGFEGRIAAFLCRGLYGMDIKTVHTFHGHVFQGYFSKWKSRCYVWIERLLAKMTDVIIAISYMQKMELTHKFNITTAKKTKIIELGFDLGPFLSCHVLKGKFRKEIGLPEEEFLIGVVGRLVPIKNHIMFLNAAKMLIESGHAKGAKFLIIGDGELRRELEYYCRKKRMDEKVIFCGWIKEVHYVYADLNLVALTSLSEGTPVSVIEAMASGVPVIATDVGGVPDLLGTPMNKNSYEGFVICERGIMCKKDDPEGLSNAIRYAMEERKDVQEARTLAAKSFVQQKYSKERLIRDIEALYMELARDSLKWQKTMVHP